MPQSILIVLTAVIEIVFLQVWSTCHNLSDKFHFSIFDANLKLQEAITNDVGYSTYAARFFHNKVIVYGTEFLNKYILFWDVRFDVLLFSLIGYFGILYGLWLLITTRRNYVKRLIILGIVLLLPLIEIFQLFQPFQVRFVITILPMYVISLFGLWQFMKRYKRKGLISLFVLLLLSLWYGSVLHNDFNNYCQMP